MRVDPPQVQPSPPPGVLGEGCLLVEVPFTSYEMPDLTPESTLNAPESSTQLNQAPHLIPRLLSLEIGSASIPIQKPK